MALADQGFEAFGELHRGSIGGILPLDKIEAVACMDGVLAVGVDPLFDRPTEPQDLVSRLGNSDLLPLYNEYKEFISSGGKSEDFVSQQYNFSGDRIQIEVFVSTRYDVAAFRSLFIEYIDSGGGGLGIATMLGGVPLGCLEDLAAMDGLVMISGPNTYIPSRLPPDLEPPQPRKGVVGGLREVYDAYCELVEQGGPIKDLVAAWDETFFLDGEYIFVDTYAYQEEAGQALDAMMRFGFQPTSASSGLGTVIRGYLPLGHLEDIVAAVDFAWLQARSQSRGLPSDIPDFSPIRPTPELVDRPSDLEAPDWSQVSDRLLAIHDEYQAFVDSGGDPADFVSQQYEFSGDRVNARVVMRSDYYSRRYVQTFVDLGFSVSGLRTHHLTGYLRLDTIEAIGAVDGISRIMFSARGRPARLPSSGDGTPAVSPPAELPPELGIETAGVCHDLAVLYAAYVEFVEAGGGNDDSPNRVADLALMLMLEGQE